MNRIAPSVCVALSFLLLGCPEDPVSNGGSDAAVDGGPDGGTDGGTDGGADGGTDGGADGGVPGACSTGGNDTGSNVRIHVVNSEDVANIQVGIMTPSGSCMIDPLPTATDAGLELGQAVFSLVVDDIISFGAQSPSGGATGQCRVNQDAFIDPNSIFVDLYITSIGFACSMGVDPL